MTTTDKDLTEALRIHHFYLRIKLNEVFVLYAVIQISKGDRYDKTYNNGITYTIEACHNIFKTLLSMDAQKFSHSPTLITIRTIYALRVLLLLQRRKDQVDLLSSNTTLGDFINFDGQINLLESYFNEINASFNHKMPQMALKAIDTIRRRYLQTKSTASGIKPMINASHDNCATTTTRMLFDAVQNMTMDISRDNTLPGPIAAMSLTQPHSRLASNISEDLLNRDLSVAEDDLLDFNASFWGALPSDRELFPNLHTDN